jgi:hypothetical protein
MRGWSRQCCRVCGQAPFPKAYDESTTEAIGDWHYWVAQGYGSSQF